MDFKWGQMAKGHMIWSLCPKSCLEAAWRMTTLAFARQGQLQLIMEPWIKEVGPHIRICMKFWSSQSSNTHAPMRDVQHFWQYGTLQHDMVT